MCASASGDGIVELHIVVEDVRKRIGRHADAGVAHAEHGALPAPLTPERDDARVSPAVAHATNRSHCARGALNSAAMSNALDSQIDSTGAPKRVKMRQRYARTP